jgi:uncharacterized membrane protein (DUF106 family)
MAYEMVILQIFFITVGMVALSMTFNKIMGIDPKSAKAFREKALNVQERMRNAQNIGDPQLMMKLQQESLALTKEMMKKQLLPTCIRCFVFWGIFGILSIFYAPYSTGILPFFIPLFGNGWVAIYFLFSIGLSLLIYLVKRLYRKLTGKEDERKKDVTEIRGILSGNSGGSTELFQLNRTQNVPTSEEPTERVDSWKERIKN